MLCVVACRKCDSRDPIVWLGWLVKYMVVRLDLTPICVAESFLQHFAPFELHIQHKNFIEHPTLSKVYIFWKELARGIQVCIQNCVQGRVRMSGLRKSTFLDQIWNFPSCVISPYPPPLLPIYHRIEFLMKFPFRKCVLEQGLNLP